MRVFKLRCLVCGNLVPQSRPRYLICIMCHLVLLLKTFPSNCFTKAHNEHVRVRAAAAL